MSAGGGRGDTYRRCEVGDRKRAGLSEGEEHPRAGAVGEQRRWNGNLGGHLREHVSGPVLHTATVSKLCSTVPIRRTPAADHPTWTALSTGPGARAGGG